MGGGGSAERPDETEAYKALANQTATFFNRYKEVFVPLENMYIESVFEAGEGAAYQKAEDIGALTAQRAFENNIGEASQELLARGIDPSSGAFKARTEDMYSTLGAARGLNAADAQIGNTDRFLGGINEVMKMGQGVNSEAAQGQIALAQTAEDKARSLAATEFSKGQQGLQALGAGAGMFGAGVYNNFGRG
jgi:hypothetical protein